MPNLDDVQRLIEGALPGAVVTVEDFAGGGGDHLAVRVTAPQFAGKPLLEQHRMVYGAVEQELGSGAIHALSIKTALPAQE
jgi:stress-induced morphogen